MKKYEILEDFQWVSDVGNHQKGARKLWRIRALYDFHDVKTGQIGGWIESEENLSQQGSCWVYDESCIYSQARVEEDSQVRDSSVVRNRAVVGGKAIISQSQISGKCHLYNDARIEACSKVIAIRGFTDDDVLDLQIYGRAHVSHSMITHQAQIYDDANVSYAFIGHRAHVSGNAQIAGNEQNEVWICDCAKIFDNARIIAGTGDSQIPTIRYSSEVYGNAMIYGDCILKRQVHIFGNAKLSGGPVQLDDNVKIYGQAQISGNVLIETSVQVCDSAKIEGSDESSVHLCGAKVINGEQYITHSPFYGIFS